tara:strand:+ start:148 stop:300 length:153 start_codon:yes stop_codon:yes gene_type:complete
MEGLKDYVKVSTLAKKLGKSVTWIYKMIENDLVDLQEIDGVKFVKEKKKD